jgi:hypothetical protein
MFGLTTNKKNRRGTIGLTTAIPILLITAVIGGIGAGLALLAGLTTIGYSVAFSAVLAGIVEAFTIYQNPTPSTAGTVTVKVLITLFASGALAGLEYAASVPVLAVPTVVAAIAVAVTYIQTHISASLKLAARAPPTP